MKITFDSEANAAYIYFKEISQGEVENTISLNEFVNIDLDKEGKVLGIEVLEANKNLPKDIISSAIAL
jgi:uncharacterized protein YuzE